MKIIKWINIKWIDFLAEIRGYFFLTSSSVSPLKKKLRELPRHRLDQEDKFSYIFLEIFFVVENFNGSPVSIIASWLITRIYSL